jgi:hypothetical protein
VLAGGDADQVADDREREADGEVGHQVDLSLGVREEVGQQAACGRRDLAGSCGDLPSGERRMVRSPQAQVVRAVRGGERGPFGRRGLQARRVPVPLQRREPGVLADGPMGQHLAGERLVGDDPHPTSHRRPDADDRSAVAELFVDRVRLGDAAVDGIEKGDVGDRCFEHGGLHGRR